MGLLCHFALSLVWMTLFLAGGQAVADTGGASAGFRHRVRHRRVLAMRLVVLPLSAFPRPVTFKPLGTVLDLASHIFLFGLPIVWATRKALYRREKVNAKVDAYMSRAKQWREESEKLREIVLACDLTEELKWGVPCYTFGDKNIVLIHGFKEYCALLFMKGALLKDPKGILITQTENVQSGRQIRFTNLKESPSWRRP